MSLISLLIALAAERYLSSPVWQFNFYYQHYLKFFNRLPFVGDEAYQNQTVEGVDTNTGSADETNATLQTIVFFVIPVLACYLLLGLLDDGLLYLIASTIVLIVCFGCVQTRNCYKQYLLAAFRGETTTCEMHHLQLLQDKKLMNMGFGQSLIWLNYRYFIAIMIFFVLFGAPGALAYRLLTKMTEQNSLVSKESEVEDEKFSVDVNTQNLSRISEQALFWVDWLPVRIVSFCYMLVGHFSKAMPVWLENLFNVDKLPHVLLVDVAQKSEDFMIDVGDCTAEPCLLVRLAKRTLLLCLAVIAILILTGVLS
ncbi:regulatory signaling modulator protein AmpE [Thalassotalea profundi]|uniref:Beta-lactamase regulator AmpE n=1 Tax=Thalassotalea profundi TaxID=2036687 RepID=A0ABQ3IUN1_9GAMM|nr:regulatory signaling modulator protein AmpE [Thalassotalea profundi]GHE95013.1 beta-lactamase regulator AmpE [Thalassotalea profundi]